MSSIHLDGCVYLLQILAMEHLFSYKRQIPRSGNKYPHIMHLIDVIVGDNELRLVCVRIWKKKATKDEVRAMTVKVVELMRKSEENEVLIMSMEKEINDILELIASRSSVLFLKFGHK
ncbi:hypothetical protein PHAVU_008G251750 [Phaseolus vulgaris]